MADEPKWTPGPWAGKGQTSEDAVFCGTMHRICADGAWLAFVPTWKDNPDEASEAEANAHLIAAAPDMAGVSPRAAEMLRVAATFLRSEEPNGTVFYDGAACDAFCIADDCEAAADDIDAALAKARGETK